MRGFLTTLFSSKLKVKRTREIEIESWSIVTYTHFQSPIHSLEFLGKTQLLLSIIVNYIVVKQMKCYEATRKFLGLVWMSIFNRA